MTVSSATNNETFRGNGVTTIWSLPFRFFDNADIFVYLVDPIAATSVALNQGTDYTLSGANLPEQFGTAPGKITTTVPVASGKQLYVERIMPIDQLTDIVNQGRFFPEVHEDVFDKLTMLIQQSDSNGKGAIRVAITDPEPARLPVAALRANLLMGFDALGNPIPVAPAGGSAASLALMLANEILVSQGEAMIGRGEQVVNSVAELRTLLKSSPSKYASTTGYHSKGDGGGGHYHLNASDVTSADNGSTLIVAADGGRWVLRTTLGAFDARQAGVVADGIADDTAAMQAAINAANSLKARLTLPGGSIRITGGLTIPQSDFSMSGVGYQTKIRHAFNGPLFTSVATVGQSEYHRYKDFRIVSDSAKTTGSYAFVFTSGLIRSTFSDIELVGNGPGNNAYGFITSDISSTFDTLMFNNVVLNQISGVGYNIPAGSGLWFVGGRVIGDSALTSGATGILLNGNMGGVWIWGTDFIQLDTGVWSTSNNGTSNRELFFAHGCADSCARFGYRFSDAAFVSMTGIWAASCASANVQLDATFTGDINIAGGTVFNAGAYGGAGGKDGFVINSGNNITLSGISFRNNAGYGIRCTVAAQPANLTMTGCQVANNGSNQLAGTKVRVSGSAFISNTNALVVASAGGACRITNTAGVNDVLSVTTPAVPASTVGHTYAGFMPITVYIAGGTVTSVVLNGQAVLSSSNCSVQVAPGDTIALTYSAVPSWAFIRADS